MKLILIILAFASLALIGCGLWAWVHPGAGLACVGGLLWLELAISGRRKAA
jgi:hypothetical protein